MPVRVRHARRARLVRAQRVAQPVHGHPRVPCVCAWAVGSRLQTGRVCSASRSDSRRKGVGKQVLLTLEMMAKQAKLSYLCALLTGHNEEGAAFLVHLCHVANGSDEAAQGEEVGSRCCETKRKASSRQSAPSGGG